MITVIGSCNTDMVVKSPRLPAPGETIIGGDFMMFDGGKGANQAVAAARAGAKVAFITAVGTDPFGDKALSNFAALDIDSRYVKRCSDAPSGVALILVDDKGENTISVAPGANMALLPSDIEKAEDLFRNSSHVLLQLEIPYETVDCAARFAKKLGCQVILNPAPSPGGYLADILSNTDILIPNEIEWQQIRETLGSHKMAAIITTLGSRGIRVCDKEGTRELPACKVTSVDTVGAGDCFCGLLTAGLAEGMSLDDAARFAMRGAAISVTRVGAQASYPTRGEIEAFC
jgi:ribokinase